MQERIHKTDALMSWAWYSPCERFRYGLRRRWDAAAPHVLYIMLNPSTATELRNDPTIERCERRARQLGYGTMSIANLFAFRATDPAELKRAPDPVGPENDSALCDMQKKADMTLAAWGVHGAHQQRHTQVLALLKGPLYHLGLTKEGLPRHPLYVSYKTRPKLWET